jgi:hypothetical protein
MCTNQGHWSQSGKILNQYMHFLIKYDLKGIGIFYTPRERGEMLKLSQYLPDKTGVVNCVWETWRMWLNIGNSYKASTEQQ